MLKLIAARGLKTSSVGKYGIQTPGKTGKNEIFLKFSTVLGQPMQTGLFENALTDEDKVKIALIR